MINFENRFDEYAYRVAQFDLDSTLIDDTTIEDGVFVTVNSYGSLVKAISATPKAYMLTTSKKAGRDLISGRAVQKGSFLLGNYALITDQVETLDGVGGTTGSAITYAPGDALTISAQGKLTKANAGSATVAIDHVVFPDKVVGYALSALVINGDGTKSLRVHII